MEFLSTELMVNIVRKGVVLIVGGVVIAAGTAMLVTPGPGLVTIAGGISILALEFDWAKRWLMNIKSRTKSAVKKVRARIKS